MSATPTFPDLADLERLGEGGMGTVFRARQVSLERTVAVKTLRDDLLDEHDLLRRFEREAKALAQVEHPHVVPVYATGEHEGRPYYIMRYVDGTGITRHLEGRAPEAVADAFRKVCLGIEAAHKAGVLHRDLKPENILVDSRGEPMVVDFGLAKRLSSGGRPRGAPGDTPRDLGGADDESLSERDVVLGTPDYLSPEVAGGDPQTTASDVYGIGATLYRVLAGQPPFPGGALLQKLRRIRGEDPAPPRRARPDVPEPLQAICLKAMERAPAERYATAAAMADDLARFLRGEPVRARPTLYRSLLDRRLAAHKDGIEEWAREGVITRRERDRLSGAYDALVEGERDSIFEMERLSTPLVFLYVGALVMALGPAVLATLAWGSSPFEGHAATLAFRLCVIGLPLCALGVAGRVVWRRGDFRTALPFIFGAALLVPPLAFVALHEVPALHEAMGEDGAAVEATLDRYNVDAGVLEGSRGAVQDVLDRTLLYVAIIALAVGLVLRRATGSPAFIWYSILTGLWVYFLLAVALGWRALEPHWCAATFMPAGALLLAAGVPLDRSGRSREARPLYIVGFIVVVVAWFLYASRGYPLEYLGPWKRREAESLSYVVGGALALGLALGAERVGTPLLYRYAVAPYVAAALGVLPSLSVLVSQHLQTYEVVLPLACIAFVGLSVLVQRKNLLYSGGGYVSIAVFQVTRNHFRDAWAWPIVVIATGATMMAIAYVAPRIDARIRGRKRRRGGPLTTPK